KALRVLQQSDPRIVVLPGEKNVGTYASKNRGILVATGEYITFHDSDDWVHPKRLSRQLDMMRSVGCTTSNWIRMEANGHTVVRRAGPYSHINHSSTFMRKELFERIGPFDCVRTGADAELMNRIRMNYGQSSVLNLDACLAIGFHHENSLTQA